MCVCVCVYVYMLACVNGCGSELVWACMCTHAWVHVRILGNTSIHLVCIYILTTTTSVLLTDS